MYTPFCKCTTATHHQQHMFDLERAAGRHAVSYWSDVMAFKKAHMIVSI